jgi:hypothetical protein
MKDVWSHNNMVKVGPKILETHKNQRPPTKHLNIIVKIHSRKKLFLNCAMNLLASCGDMWDLS